VFKIITVLWELQFLLPETTHLKIPLRCLAFLERKNTHKLTTKGTY